MLETVVNNLEVTNNLNIEPEIRCRVLMTSTLESFTIGHTIVVSRGLIDVLPDEASLATHARARTRTRRARLIASTRSMRSSIGMLFDEKDDLPPLRLPQNARGRTGRRAEGRWNC